MRVRVCDSLVFLPNHVVLESLNLAVVIFNREDGYLFGVDNMIQLFESIHEELSSAPEKQSSENPIDLPPKPIKILPLVDIVVTAPSPTSSRKGVLRRQVAETVGDDHVTHNVTSDVDKKSLT